MGSHFDIEDERKKQPFWHIMLYYFKKGKNATEMPKKISAAYGEGAEADGTCQNWFARFRAGDILLDDAPWSGSPAEVDGDQIKVLRPISIIHVGDS